MTMGYRASKYALDDIPSLRRERSWIDELPLMQWATRWELADETRKSGWVIERGKDAELDAALADLDVATFAYTHSNSRTATPYWHLNGVYAFVLATRVDTTWDMDKDLAKRHGIAYARMAQGTGGSVVRGAAFLERLVDAGYPHPVRFVASRSMGYRQMVPALMDHYRVIRKLQELAGWDRLPTFYEAATALLPGPLETWAGATGDARVVPIAKQGAPSDITRDYVAQHYIGTKARKWLIQTIEAPREDGTTMMDDVIEWSIAESERIYQMTTETGGVAGSNPDAKSFLVSKTEAKPAAEPTPPSLPDDLPF